jgi:hypothetical protein
VRSMIIWLQQQVNYGEALSRCLVSKCSMAALRRLNGMVAATAVFWLPARVREKGLVRSLAPIVCLSPPLLPAFYQTAVPGIDYSTPFPYPNWNACLSLRMFIAVWTPLVGACDLRASHRKHPSLAISLSMNNQTTTAGSHA